MALVAFEKRRDFRDLSRAVDESRRAQPLTRAEPPTDAFESSRRFLFARFDGARMTALGSLELSYVLSRLETHGQGLQPIRIVGKEGQELERRQLASCEKTSHLVANDLLAVRVRREMKRLAQGRHEHHRLRRWGTRTYGIVRVSSRESV